MSPLEIHVILEVYAFGNSFDGHYAGSDTTATKQARSKFLKQGVIRLDENTDSYELTDRGQAYVDFLLAMPLPTELKSWHMPTYDEWEGIDTLA